MLLLFDYELLFDGLIMLPAFFIFIILNNCMDNQHLWLSIFIYAKLKQEKKF